MKKRVKRIMAAICTAAMMPAMPCTTNISAAESTIVTLNPANASPFNNGRFEGWGTSLCWWANRLGYSSAMTKQAAELFFSENGLGLDIARYNLGGGDDPTHTHITRSDSNVPGYATGFDADGKLIYDWSADQNQRNIALAALEANPDLYFEGFSNSPPYFMTNSGCSSGAESASANNLRDDMYDAFATYIADVTKHFADNFGIKFESYSPMNEPDTNYWGAFSPKQEGCHYDPGTSQSNIIIATRKALDAAGLNDVIVAGMDETSIDSSVNNLGKLTAEAQTALGRIDTHSYSGSKRAQLKDKAVSMGKTLWMSEVDQGGTGGTNAGNMSMGLNLANLILADMNGMQPAAWVMWDIVDLHRDAHFAGEENNTLNQNGKLWGVGMGNHDTQKIELTQKYYVFGQFTKYINPGDTIIASSPTTLAAYNKDNGSVKIVAVNTDSSAKNYIFDMSAFNKTGAAARIIRTSGAFSGGEHWADLGTVAVKDKKFAYDLPANSVTTFVIDNDVSDIGYITLDGPSFAVKGNSYTFTSKTSDASPVTWLVSDESLARITQNGVFTAKSGGSVTVTATSATLGSKSVQVLISAADKVTPVSVSGSQSWNGVASTSAQAAADGNLSTFFDGLNAGYVTLDLGSPHSISMLGYAPRSGYEYRMIDGTFYGSNDASSWTQLYKITSKPSSGAITLVYSEDLENTDTAYRYIQYSVPSGKQSYNGKSEDYNCNIAEIEVYAINDDTAANIIIRGGDTVERGSSAQYTAEFINTDAADFTWSVSDESLAEIDAYGVLSAKAVGSVTVYARCPSLGINASKKVNIDWAQLIPESVSGSIPYGGESDTNNCLKAVDGDVNTFFDGMADGYVTLDLGGYCRIEKLAYAPRSRFGSRMNQTAFYASADGEYWDTIYSVNSSQSDGMHYVTNLQNASKVYRYVKYTGTNYSNIAEIAVYGEKFETNAADSANVIFKLDFDNTLTPSVGRASAHGNIEFIDGVHGKAAYLDGSDYIELFANDGSSLLAGLDGFTVSFSARTDAQSWWFYAAANANAQTYRSEKYIGVLDSADKFTCERYNSNAIDRPAAAGASHAKDEWVHVTLVHADGYYCLYLNGSCVNVVRSAVDIKSMLGSKPIAYIGMAKWGSGEYSVGAIDDFKVYDAPLSDDAVMREYLGATLSYAVSGDNIAYKADGIPAGASLCIALKRGGEMLGASFAAEGSFNVEDADGCTLEAFIWDNAMKPICDKITGTKK